MRKRRLRWLAFASVCASAGGAGCSGTVFAPFPPPQQCPTLEDDDWLVDVAPVPETPTAAVDVQARVERYVYAGAYCRTAEHRLR